MALESPDADGLAAAVERKSALAGRLAAIERRRDALLREAGFPDGSAGIEAWLSRPDNAAARRDWTAVRERAARAREGNEINGRLLVVNLQHNRQALDTLLGNGGSSTYGADGQTSGAATGRRLGSA